MATLGYGMYGLNVLNPNGETDSLPFARLSGTQSQGGGLAIYFDQADSDEYGMVLPNQGGVSGTYSAVRTPVSGLYEIELDILRVSGAGSGVSEIDIYIDKQAVFGASGVFSPNGSGLGYTVSIHRIYIAAASSNASHTLKKTLFLEKDCYISLYHTTTSGTATATTGYTSAYFQVRCVSTEQSNKTAYQTS